MRVVAAPDKFRGTATAAQVAGAVAAAARRVGWDCDEVPLADGGEGTIEAFGGPNRTTSVTGPLGAEVRAAWRLDHHTAVIETARVIGLDLIGGPEGNDAVAASTIGVGQLLNEAADAGARRFIVSVGGSCTTDGGLAAVRAVFPRQRLRGLEVVVACDVRTPFLDAAEVFAPQKGATPAQVALLARRLERIAQVYLDEFGVEVRELEGAGAAGGLAGGLAVLGARLVPGFDLVADELELAATVEGADLVVTGEGFLDEQSFDGKVVGGVANVAAQFGVPVLAVAGEVFDGVEDRVDAVSLAARFGDERARADVLACVEEVVAEALAAHDGAARDHAG